MSEWLRRFYSFNAKYNDLPRRLIYIFGIMVACLLIARVFPYVAPFAIAAAIAWALEPVMRLITTHAINKFKIGRKIAAAILTLVVLVLILALVLMISGRLLSEVKNLIEVAPGWIYGVYTRATDFIKELDINLDMISEETVTFALDMLKKVAESALSMTTSFASTLTVWLINAAMAVPGCMLFFVLLFMGVFYMLGDRPLIAGFINRVFPEQLMRRGLAVKGSLIHSLFGQLRSGLIMLMVTMAELIIGFTIMRLNYAVLLGILIAVLDALPVIGAGLFLIPMSLYAFITGNLPIGIGMAVLYGLTIVIRQIFEPKILGHQLGLHPLATMMAMYAGYKLIGFLGMAIGPMLLLISRAVLSEAGAPIIPPSADGEIAPTGDAPSGEGAKEPFRPFARKKLPRH